MPNCNLHSHYKEKVLTAGKTTDKTRFNLSKSKTFEVVKDNNSRIKVVYFDKTIEAKFKKNLSLYEKRYNEQYK